VPKNAVGLFLTTSQSVKSSRKDSEVLIDLQLDRRDDEGSRKRLGHFIALICFDIAFMHCRLPTFE